MDGLTASEQQELQKRMEKKQIKEFMGVLQFPLIQIKFIELWLTAGLPQAYSMIVQRCFEDCISDFTTKSLISREEGCVNRCFDKYMKTAERVNQRFQEQGNEMMQAGQIPGK
ncbi:protein transporter tim9 [Ophidiomyces ophidiicola]|nr:protein transporter tim9 [Ophidiomyces ophidiicola]KAI1939565.1 protein transporter tim9 [Ophidiomyces ophidiicola]KAI1960280.1 protein transporter tim9 [Ophidiomyces ophidiicola]